MLRIWRVLRRRGGRSETAERPERIAGFLEAEIVRPPPAKVDRLPYASDRAARRAAHKAATVASLTHWPGADETQAGVMDHVIERARQCEDSAHDRLQRGHVEASRLYAEAARRYRALAARPDYAAVPVRDLVRESEAAYAYSRAAMDFWPGYAAREAERCESEARQHSGDTAAFHAEAGRRYRALAARIRPDSVTADDLREESEAAAAPLRALGQRDRAVREAERCESEARQHSGETTALYAEAGRRYRALAARIRPDSVSNDGWEAEYEAAHEPAGAAFRLAEKEHRRRRRE